MSIVARFVVVSIIFLLISANAIIRHAIHYFKELLLLLRFVGIIINSLNKAKLSPSSNEINVL